MTASTGPPLDTLFLATPLSFSGRLVQYVRRVRRSAPGKTDAIVIDYTDDHPMLWSQWANHRGTYQREGYQVIHPKAQVAW